METPPAMISCAEGVPLPAQHAPVLSGDLDATGWGAQWRDPVEIEFVSVVSGKDTAATFARLLEGGAAGEEA